MKRVPRLPFLIAGSALFLALSANAQAQTTIGQVAPPNPPAICSNGPFDIFANGTTDTPVYSVPTSGLITSWSTSAAAGAGQELEFKVFRKIGPGNLLVVGHNGPRSLTPSVLNTFTTSIPVQAGDLIGDNDLNASSVNNACWFATGSATDIDAYFAGNTADGATIGVEGEEPGFRVNVSATVLLASTVTAITPASGSIKGGTSVVITGSNFAEVKGVSFGSVPASSFTVNSESQLTAVAPASKTLATVPVTVTNIVGKGTSASTFAYEGCKVPALASKKLKAAKKKLKKADCKIGKVKKLGDATAKTGEVVKQNPKPGKILAPGSKVNVKLG